MQIAVSFLSAAQNELILRRGEAPRSVILPFGYKHLSPEERQQIVWVPESFYTVINPGSHIFALVGPLCPCLLIALKNKTTGQIIIFHKSFANSIDNLIEIAQREINFSNPADIVGFIFTNNLTNPEEAQEFTTLRNGMSQQEEVAYVKNRLIDSLHIEDTMQITINFFTSQLAEGALADYAFAELSVIIGEDFEPHSICMMHENIFKNLDDIDLENRKKVFGEFTDLYLSYLNCLTATSSSLTWNTDFFVKIDSQLWDACKEKCKLISIEGL